MREKVEAVTEPTTKKNCATRVFLALSPRVVPREQRHPTLTTALAPPGHLCGNYVQPGAHLQRNRTLSGVTERSARLRRHSLLTSLKLVPRCDVPCETMQYEPSRRVGTMAHNNASSEHVALCVPCTVQTNSSSARKVTLTINSPLSFALNAEEIEHSPRTSPPIIVHQSQQLR